MRAPNAGDAQRSRAWAGRCSPEARSPDLPFKHFAQRGFEFFLLSKRIHIRPPAMLRERKPLDRHSHISHADRVSIPEGDQVAPAAGTLKSAPPKGIVNSDWQSEPGTKKMRV